MGTKYDSDKFAGFISTEHIFQVPADLRLIELKTASISVDESSLTGESLAIEKVSY
jgi:magnesium-transporting ATPase (P-type)